MTEEKNKGGRPPVVLTPEQIREVETLAAVLNQDQISDYFGITRVTFGEIMKRQPEVSIRYNVGKAKAIASIGGNLISQARAGNVSAQTFYLKTQAGWKETQVVDSTSSDGSMSPKDPKVLSDFYASAITKPKP